MFLVFVMADGLRGLLRGSVGDCGTAVRDARCGTCSTGHTRNYVRTHTAPMSRHTHSNVQTHAQQRPIICAAMSRHTRSNVQTHAQQCRIQESRLLTKCLVNRTCFLFPFLFTDAFYQIQLEPYIYISILNHAPHRWFLPARV